MIFDSLWVRLRLIMIIQVFMGNLVLRGQFIRCYFYCLVTFSIDLSFFACGFALFMLFYDR